MKARALAMRPYGTTRAKKRQRRAWRKHAALIARQMPERAAVWRRRARNG